MKLEDLKNSRLGNRSGHPWLFGLFVQDFGLPAVQVTFGDAYDFDDAQTALLAAAHFRASHEVVESCKNLLAALEDFHISVEDYPWISEAFERFRAALALADNTNETLPL